MKRVPINVDIGERGADHPVDRALLECVDIANIACGGHAGDAASVRAFMRRATERGVRAAAHLSYPDPANFGRVSMRLPERQLLDVLDRQYALMAGTATVKFHGALYNDACADRRLAEALAAWLAGNAVSEVITSHDGALAHACRRAGGRVLAEAFAERRYAWSPSTGRLSLVSRAHPHACITDCARAMEQVRSIVERGRVSALVGSGAPSDPRREIAIRADTICIHSDSGISLELARAVRAFLASRFGRWPGRATEE
jgi:UPF0271 protein